MQPCKTGDQLYSDVSLNGECSLAGLSLTFRINYLPLFSQSGHSCSQLFTHSTIVNFDFRIALTANL